MNYRSKYATQYRGLIHGQARGKSSGPGPGDRAGSAVRRRLGVLAERNFRLFYVGYTSSLLGTSMSAVAVAFAVLESGGTATDLGIVFAANIVPMIAFLLGGGVIADRLGRRPVMLIADVARCAAQGTLAAVLFTGRPQLWLFVAIALVVGTGNAFFQPALSGLTVQLAPRDQLGNANALFGMAQPGAQVAGPALAGVLIAVASPAAVIAADAASYAVSAVALGLLRFPAREGAGVRARGRGRGEGRGRAGPRGHDRAGARDRGEGRGRAGVRGHDRARARGRARARRRVRAHVRGRGRAGPPSLLRELAEGWSEFASRRWLCAGTVQGALFNLITWGPYLVLGPVLAQQYLGGARAWGAVMACYGAGAIIGGLLALGRRPARPVLFATLAMFGFPLPPLALALHAPVVIVAAAAALAGAGSALGNAIETTVIQQQVPEDALARVGAFQMVGAFAFGPIAFAAAGPVAAAVGARALLGFGAAWAAAGTLVLLTLPSVRQVTWLDAPARTPAVRRPATASPAADRPVAPTPRTTTPSTGPTASASPTASVGSTTPGSTACAAPTTSADSTAPASPGPPTGSPAGVGGQPR
jgi:MFS family permease